MLISTIVYIDGTTRILKSSTAMLDGKETIREKMEKLIFDTGVPRSIVTKLNDEEMFSKVYIPTPRPSDNRIPSDERLQAREERRQHKNGIFQSFYFKGNF